MRRRAWLGAWAGIAAAVLMLVAYEMYSHPSRAQADTPTYGPKEAEVTEEEDDRTT